MVFGFPIFFLVCGRTGEELGVIGRRRVGAQLLDDGELRPRRKLAASWERGARGGGARRRVALRERGQGTTKTDEYLFLNFYFV